MKKLFVSNLISVDGYYEGPNASIDWFKVDDEFKRYSKEMLDTVDTILFGRVTYDLMASYWPLPQAMESDPEVAVRMNRLLKVVFSKTLSSAPWNNTRLVTSDLAKEVNRLKGSNGDGRNLVVLGSGDLVRSLADLGLIDEYRLIVSPVLLGNGMTLFKGIKERICLNLFHTEVLGSGTVILYYRPE